MHSRRNGFAINRGVTRGSMATLALLTAGLVMMQNAMAFPGNGGGHHRPPDHVKSFHLTWTDGTNDQRTVTGPARLPGRVTHPEAIRSIVGQSSIRPRPSRGPVVGDRRRRNRS